MNILRLITGSMTANVIIESPFDYGWYFISMFFLLLLGLMIFTTTMKFIKIEKLEKKIKRLEKRIKKLKWVKN